MNFKIIKSHNEFLKLEPVWNDLLSRSGSNHIHLTFEWMNLWIKYFGKETSLFVIVCEEGDKITAIAPMAIHKVGKLFRNTLKFRQLTLLGNGFQDFSDFIVTGSRDEILQGFLKVIIENEDQWDEINFKQINTASPNFEFFQSFAAGENYEQSFDEIIGCPFLRIDGTFEDYYKSIGGSWRKKNERNIRKLEAIGEIKFEANTEMSEELYKDILEMNIERNKRNGRRSILLEEPKISFIKKMLPMFAEKKWIRVFTLRHNGKLLTYSISFDYNNRIYRWNTSFNLDYYDYSVGRIITKYIIRFCFENKYEISDWMAGVEDHKFHWTSEQTFNYNFFIAKKNLKSLIAKKYSETKKEILSKSNVQ